MNNKSPLPYRLLALLDTALAALLYRVALWLDGVVIGPHHVTDCHTDSTPPLDDDRLDFTAITETLRKKE